MRTGAIIAVALVSLAVQPATSQSVTTETPILTDPTGDVDAVVAGQSEPIPMAGLDLVALRVSEEVTSFKFTVGVTDLGDDRAGGPDAGHQVVYFDYKGNSYMLDMYRPLDTGSIGNIWARDGTDGQFTFIREVPAFRSIQEDTVSASFDRSDIVGNNGGTPARGDVLENIHVATAHWAEYFSDASGESSPFHFTDVMPNSEASPGSWLVQLHGHDGSGAVLASAEPFRASNGEATTYRFLVQFEFQGDAAAQFRLTTNSMPPGWAAQIPGEFLDVLPNHRVDFPVFVTTPFRHQHGISESFELRAEQIGGQAWATIELGVSYLAIPQPSGHHPDLTLHTYPLEAPVADINSAFGGRTGQITMNAQADDPGDSKQPVLGRAEASNYQPTYHWYACLNPPLRLGLDFDLNATGTLTVPFSTSKPLPGAVLTGRLLLVPPARPLDYCEPLSWAEAQPIVLADISSEPTDLPANSQSAIVTATITPTAESDYIAYETDMELVMELVLSSEGGAAFGAAGPGLQSGASMHLPLLEYHDSDVVVTREEATIDNATFSTQPAKHDSPGLAVGIPLVLAVALAAFRRRR